MISLAGSVSLDDLLLAMSASRPVFHSEADFQHEFAWQARLLDPTLSVRLESRPNLAERAALDVLLSNRDSGVGTAVELKYLKAAWAGTIAGESFDLKATGAHDITRYDVVKDIMRVEGFLRERPAWNGGYVICVSNDSLHWRAPSHSRPTIADAFRIHDGATLSGELAWGEAAGPGTTKSRETLLQLEGSYTMTWKPYSRVAGPKNSEFRVLVVPIDRPRAR